MYWEAYVDGSSLSPSTWHGAWPLVIMTMGWMNWTLLKYLEVSPLEWSSEPVYQQQENGFLEFLWSAAEHLALPAVLFSLPLFFAPLSSSHLASSPSPLSAVRATTQSYVAHLTWTPLRGPWGRWRNGGKRKPLMKLLPHWQNSSGPTCCHCCENLK